MFFGSTAGKAGPGVGLVKATEPLHWGETRYPHRKKRGGSLWPLFGPPSTASLFASNAGQLLPKQVEQSRNRRRRFTISEGQ
jgi:hypothetical protein